MSNAETFHAWRDAHYPNASRVHTQMMYAAWAAASTWKPKAAAPPPKPKAPPKPKPSTRRSSPGDE